MKIKGLQKLTLIDYPKKLACTIFLYGCNFKCGFCHNPELVTGAPEQEYTEEEIFAFLEKKKKYLDGVCISGGEPLMTIEVGFLKQIKALGYLIKIDTNGCFPEKLKELIDAGLVDYVSMDIKVSKGKYPEVANSLVELDKIDESIKLVSSLPEYEFRTTVISKYHDVIEIEKIMKWLESVAGKKIKRFCLQGFKNQGKLVDDSLKGQPNTTEDVLGEMKLAAEDYCEEVVIRV